MCIRDSLGATAALCMACCCVSKTIKEWKKKKNMKKDVVPNDDVVPNVVPKDNEDDAELGWAGPWARPPLLLPICPIV